MSNMIEVNKLTKQFGQVVAVDRISFSVKKGEVVGFLGPNGAGKSTTMRILTTYIPATSGTAIISGDNILGKEPRFVRDHGIAHIPEDRLSNGVAGDISINENLVVDRFHRQPYTINGFLQPKRVAENGRELIEQFGIVAKDGEVEVRSLSGGNMQKVVVSREFSSQPRLLIAAQPTRGVDVGAIEFIHQQLVDQRTAGLAILLVSAELQEVMKLSDRLLVMYDGKVAAAFTDVGALSEEELGLYMAGSRHQDAAELAAALSYS